MRISVSSEYFAFFSQQKHGNQSSIQLQPEQHSTEKKQEAAITMMATPKPSIRKADSLELVSTYLSWILTGVVGLIPDGTPISSPFLKPLESTRTQLEMRVLPLYR
jgi:hypothetical protein